MALKTVNIMKKQTVELFNRCKAKMYEKNISKVTDEITIIEIAKHYLQEQKNE